jgi:hypothetical protein
MWIPGHITEALLETVHRTIDKNGSFEIHPDLVSFVQSKAYTGFMFETLPDGWTKVTNSRPLPPKTA